MLMQNQNGQALMESLMCLSFVIMTSLGVFALSAHKISSLLIDHWAHQSALCLAQFQRVSICQQGLKQRLQKLPMLQFQIHKFSRNQTRVWVELATQGYGHKQVFHEELRLPLQPEDFRGPL